MSIDLLHHYTDINTLALILKNRTIRFNRLDRVDDITEGESFTNLKLEKFYFVSCWTYDSDESLPQWNMYTPDMAGVRITLPKKMFDYKPIVIPQKMNPVVNGNLYSQIPFEKMFGAKYFIFPFFFDENMFGRVVQYFSDFENKKNDAIRTNIDVNGTANIQISDPTGIAALKSPAWEFQKEYRFVLFIFPSLNIPMDINYFSQFSKEIPNLVVTSLYYGKGPDLDFFDVDIGEDELNNIVITTGPLCTEGDFIIVESLIGKYSSNGRVVKSRFTGTIRRSRKK